MAVTTCQIEKVYYKIQQLRERRENNVQGISIDALSNELSINRDIVKEYVNALNILEMIHGYDCNKEVIMG